MPKDRHASLEEFLLSRIRDNRVSFHMPGHKGAALFQKTGHGDFLREMANADITEIPGADDLFHPTGLIADIQARYQKLYEVRKSYLLVNGSSGGLIAAILATVPRGGKLIVARNCHKAVFNALTLGDITPVYVTPELLLAQGICGGVGVAVIEEALREHPDAAGAIVTSPNYYGIRSDLAALAEVLHGQGKVLLVDQAHGAHQAFFDKWLSGQGEEIMPRGISAENSGADIAVDSIHKTLAGFTQSALLNVVSDRVDLAKLEDALQMIQSSSPSYLLMTGLEISADMLEKEGPALIASWQDHLDYFYEEATQIPGLRILEDTGMDPTKINFSIEGDDGAALMDGETLAEILAEKYAIDMELATGEWVLALTGIGNVGEDYDRLLLALREIAATAQEEAGPAAKKIAATAQEEAGPAVATYSVANEPMATDSVATAPATTGSEAAKEAAILGRPHTFDGIPSTRQKVPLEAAAGKVAAASVIPYPPGIPLLCPGEVIDASDIAQIQSLRRKDISVLGVSEEGTVFVGEPAS